MAGRVCEEFEPGPGFERVWMRAAVGADPMQFPPLATTPQARRIDTGFAATKASGSALADRKFTPCLTTGRRPNDSTPGTAVPDKAA